MADTLQGGRAARTLQLGLMVARAAAVSPQTTHTPYFTVAGGLCLVTSLIGLVTTIFSATETDLKFIGEPTAGTSADICALLDAENLEAGTILVVPGLNSSGMFGTNAGVGSGLVQPFIVNTGTIDLNATGNNTGATRWVLTYVPIDDGASIVAA